MTDKDKDLKIELSDEVKAQIAGDPKTAAALQEMIANMHQAYDAVKRGQYKTYDDAMEALTGSRPEKYDLKTGEKIEGETMHKDMGLDDES